MDTKGWLEGEPAPLKVAYPLIEQSIFPRPSNRGLFEAGRGGSFSKPLNLIKEPMNKSDLVDHIAEQAEISRAAAERALNAVTGAVQSTLRKGDSVTLVGFGTFSVAKRAARTGRNPRNGEPVKIKARKVPKFSAGKALKDALN